MSRNGIDGKTVLIAGGAKNLGGLLAREFARHGAKAIAIHYNSDATRGRGRGNGRRGQGGRCPSGRLPG